MKDYRLSDIKAHCKAMEQKGVTCYACSLRYFCGGDMLDFIICPREWDIDETSDQTADNIIEKVKGIIWNNGTFDEMGETVTLDGNDIDHIAEQIAEEILKRQ